jgi:hypothetical protein
LVSVHPGGGNRCRCMEEPEYHQDTISKDAHWRGPRQSASQLEGDSLPRPERSPLQRRPQAVGRGAVMGSVRVRDAVSRLGLAMTLLFVAASSRCRWVTSGGPGTPSRTPRYRRGCGTHTRWKVQPRCLRATRSMK